MVTETPIVYSTDLYKDVPLTRAEQIIVEKFRQELKGPDVEAFKKAAEEMLEQGLTQNQVDQSDLASARLWQRIDQQREKDSRPLTWKEIYDAIDPDEEKSWESRTDRGRDDDEDISEEQEPRGFRR